jgi:hypothetical protein
MEARIGQHQDALGRQLHADAGVDESLQTRDAFAVEDLREPLCVGVKDFRPTILHRDLPRIPQRRGEKDERNDTEGYVAK